jgi:hypothetical protein
MVDGGYAGVRRVMVVLAAMVFAGPREISDIFYR